jgi:hypothetical protein
MNSNNDDPTEIVIRTLEAVVLPRVGLGMVSLDDLKREIKAHLDARVPDALEFT